MGPEHFARQFRLISFYGVAEVCKFHDMIVVLNQDIQRLDVSVINIQTVTVLNCLNEFLEVEPRILLLQNSAAVKQIEQSANLCMFKYLVYHLSRTLSTLGKA